MGFNTVSGNQKPGYNTPPTVYMLDGLDTKILPIDPFDEEADRAHGSAVADFIRKECPAAEILCFPVEYEVDGTLTSNMGEVLNGLNNYIESNGKPDVVNISIERPITIDKLARATKLPLTKDNLKDYKEQVREWMKSNNPETNKELEELEKITAQEIPVNISAGNQGSQQVNLFSFAKGVTTVGAGTAQNRKIAEAYSADNTLIDKWEIGTYPVEEVFVDGSRGYDYTGDGIPEIFADETSAGDNPYQSVKYPKEVLGSSFSNGVITSKLLRKIKGNACDL